MGVLFDEQVAPHYEAWFETSEGRRADRLEKALLGRLHRRRGAVGSVACIPAAVR